MLTQLTIKNFGLIDAITLELTAGLIVLTGETGAGKSIMIDALRYALGERFDQSLVRTPSAACTVEAVFDCSSNILRTHPAIAEFLTDEEPALIIHRTYQPDGRSRIKINGLTVTLAQLRELGNHLIDFHGAHDHQLLFSERSHLAILDHLTDLTTLKDGYADTFRAYCATASSIEEIRESGASRDRDLDLLTHQIRELERVPLAKERYDDLKSEEKRLANAEKLHTHAALLVRLLTEEESGMTDRLAACFAPGKALAATDPGAAPLVDKLESLQGSLDELAQEANGYLESLSFEPEEARDIERRCDIYEDIIRKYGPTIEDAAGFLKKARERHAFLTNLEHNDAELQKELLASENELRVKAAKISRKRRDAADMLKKTIEKELKELGMPHVTFECRVEKGTLNADGQDAVTFYISPNAGEPLKPLASIVSSGEAARVMLALKKALIKADPIPVLVFDEIDASIGGRLGTVTGTKLRDLSCARQVILVTHLPQIASFADRHFKVAKQVSGSRTVTKVELLEDEDRVNEIAKMMSGEKESEISVEHARELLEKAKISSLRGR